MGLTTRIAAALSRRSVGGTEWYGSSVVSPGSWGEVRLGDAEGEWTASAAAARCIEAIASNASSLSLQVRDTNDDTTIDGHWLSALWERPNETWSRRAMGQVLWSRMESKGQAFVYMERGRNGTGRPSALWPILVRVVPVIADLVSEDDDGGTDSVRQVVLGYHAYLRKGRRISLLPEEVLWLRYPDPSDPFKPLAPLEAAGHAVELDAYARGWQRSEFRNGAKPKHVVYMGQLNEQAHNAAVEMWRSQVEGQGNAGKSLLLSGPQRTQVDRLTATPEEMSWLETRKVSWEEVMLAFGVPKDYLLGGATYENRAAARTTLWSDTIVPKLEIVASEITRQALAVEAGRRARFDTDEVDALQEGEDAKAKRAGDLTAVDVLTLDEARAEMGLDPLPNGTGALTLTPYRALVQLQAQQALLDGRALANPQAALGIAVTPGRLGPTGAIPPLLLPSGRRLHGPSADEVQAEYDRHERLVAKAVARLASRQQAVVITNAERLLGGKSKKAASWLRDVAHASMAYAAAPRCDTDCGDPECALEEQVRAAEAELRVKAEDLFDPKHWRGETRADLEVPVGGAWNSGATKIAASLGLDFSKFDVLVLTAMDNRLDVLADQVTDTTRQIIENRVLLQAVANGESIDTIKSVIRGIFTDLSSWRAATIARTEVVGGFNAASYTLAEASGVVVERQWLATLDARTRDTHAAQDGDKVKGFKTRYANGCLHPGDPTARAEETVNCRCVELYVTED